MVRCLTAFIKCSPELVEGSQQCDKARMLRQAQHDIKKSPDNSTGDFLGLISPSTIKSWVVAIEAGTH